MSNDTKTYRWAHPIEWLHDRIDGHESLDELKACARTLASMLDGDQIQDEFQSDMDADGYFEPEGDARCSCAINADGSDDLPYDADCPVHGEEAANG